MGAVDQGLSAAAELFGTNVADLELVAGGVMNKHWLVRGTALVLRRYGRGRGREAVLFEHVVLSRLRRLGWPVAVPIPTAEGKTVVERGRRLYALFPLLEGSPSTDYSAPLLRELGTVAARLHIDSRSLMELGPRLGVDRLVNLSTGWPGWAGPGNMPRILATVRSHPLIDAERVQREIELLAAELSQRSAGDLPETVLHGDLGPHHLLWAGGKLSGLPRSRQHSGRLPGD